MTSKVTRVSHMTLIVNDQEKAAAFYAAVFGTEVRSDDAVDMGPAKMRFLTIGIPGDDLEIAIMLPMAMPGREPPKAGDANMSVAAATDVDAVCAAALAAGGSVASEPEELPWGRSAVIRDPDGNPWNLVATN